MPKMPLNPACEGLESTTATPQMLDAAGCPVEVYCPAKVGSITWIGTNTAGSPPKMTSTV